MSFCRGLNALVKERFPRGFDREAGVESRSAGDGAIELGEMADERIEAQSPLPFTAPISTIAGKVKMGELK